MKRDLSKAQFVAATEKLGFVPTGFMGYFRLPIPHNNVSVCSLNAGDRLRDRLAYLKKEHALEISRVAAKSLADASC